MITIFTIIKMIIIVLFGKPCRKGTQAEFWKENTILTHLSPQEIFRFNISRKPNWDRLAKLIWTKAIWDETIKISKAKWKKNQDSAGFLEMALQEPLPKPSFWCILASKMIKLPPRPWSRWWNLVPVLYWKRKNQRKSGRSGTKKNQKSLPRIQRKNCAINGLLQKRNTNFTQSMVLGLLKKWLKD